MGREIFKVRPTLITTLVLVLSLLTYSQAMTVCTYDLVLLCPCKPVISGSVRQDGQALAADDPAVRGPGEEEVHGGRGLQGGPQTPPAETQGCGKTACKGTHHEAQSSQV